MYKVGRLCVKLAGRDARQKCVIVEVLDDHYVLIDGQTRRRKCNVRHLEPLDKVLSIKKGADHKTVAAALKKEGIEVQEKKPKKAKLKSSKKQETKKDKKAKKPKTKKSSKKETKKSKKKSSKGKKSAKKKSEKK